MKTISHGVLWCLLLVFSACEKRQPDPVPLDKVQEYQLRSDFTNDNYRIYVWTPPNYNQDTTVYPVLFQLDGNTTTSSAIAHAEKGIADKGWRPYLVVAVDYLGEDERERDFSPTPQPQFPGSGKAGAYRQFLEWELVPFIETLYRTDTVFGHTLRGHSLGGLLAVTLLLDTARTAAPVFPNLIIESPSLWWDDDVIFTLEHAYAQANSQLPFKAYFSVGEREGALMKATLTSLEQQLTNRNHQHFTARFETLNNWGHRQVRDENTNGFTYIFGQ